MIELKNIDLENVTLKEQYKKAFEEQHELEIELMKLEEKIHLQSLTSLVIDDLIERQNVISEFWDVVQAWLGVLAKEGITADEVMAGYPKHLEKIKHRPR